MKEVLEKNDPKLAENQLIFPDQAAEDAHLQAVSPEDEAELDERFQQRDRRLAAAPQVPSAAR